MDHSNRLPAMPTTSYLAQERRQHLGPGFEPNGFDRYADTRRILHGMPVLCGVGYYPGRFMPVGPLEEDFPKTGAY